jgi:hypothetical protein
MGLKRVGVGSVMALVLSVVASGAAAAEPVFLTKAVVAEGSSIPLTGTTGVSLWEGANGSKIVCASGTVTGEVTGPQSLANTVFVLHGCETQGCKVTGEGQPEGVVQSKVLAGKLGGITGTLPGIKLFSQSEGKGGKVFVASTCSGAITILYDGEVTGSLSPSAGENAETGKLAASVKLTFAKSKPGIQKYQGFSEGPEAGLIGQLQGSIGGGAFEPTAWGITATFKTVPASWGLGITK